MKYTKDPITISRFDALFILGMMDSNKGHSKLLDQIAERLSKELDFK